MTFTNGETFVGNWEGGKVNGDGEIHRCTG